MTPLWSREVFQKDFARLSYDELMNVRERWVRATSIQSNETQRLALLVIDEMLDQLNDDEIPL